MTHSTSDLHPTPDYERADALYDALSEALRTRPRHAGEAHAVIRSADRAMTDLDDHLRKGGALPSAWHRAERPDTLKA